MKRQAIEKLIKWKNRIWHKPLIIHGARQVGKTWIMKEFAKTEYKDMAYIYFEKNDRMAKLFSGGMDIERILLGLEIEVGHKIIPHKTLIIFDEIQACPNALTFLKFINENAPEYDIVAAGSLLGVFLHQSVSFPVGKVEFMNLYPMNFVEFLEATGEQALSTVLKNQNMDQIKIFHDKYIYYLRLYFYIGGMPEAVLNFINNKDFNAVRRIQNDILTSYDADFSNHVPINDIQKVVQIFNSIPSQLAKENRKFIFSKMGGAASGIRASHYETAIEWLIRGGLVHRIFRVTKPALPLKSYAESSNAFKLFMVDIGLLSAMSKLDSSVLLDGDALFTEFKGALSEQFVYQEICSVSENIDTAYWANENPATAEVDFIIQYAMQVIPIEVKSSLNLRAKSLAVYRKKFTPQVEIRTSLADYKKTGNLYDIPLYLFSYFKEIINK